MNKIIQEFSDMMKNERYKQCIQYYTEASSIINNYLQYNMTLYDDDFKEIVEAKILCVSIIKDLFKYISPLENPITLYRNITGADVFLPYHKHFVSTSIEKYTNDDPDDIYITIHVPIGMKVLPILKWSQNPSEKEILLPNEIVFINRRMIKPNEMIVDAIYKDDVFDDSQLQNYVFDRKVSKTEDDDSSDW